MKILNVCFRFRFINNPCCRTRDSSRVQKPGRIPTRNNKTRVVRVYNWKSSGPNGRTVLRHRLCQRTTESGTRHKCRRSERRRTWVEGRTEMTVFLAGRVYKAWKVETPNKWLTYSWEGQGSRRNSWRKKTYRWSRTYSFSGLVSRTSSRRRRGSSSPTINCTTRKARNRISKVTGTTCFRMSWRSSTSGRRTRRFSSTRSSSRTIRNSTAMCSSSGGRSPIRNSRSPTRSSRKSTPPNGSMDSPLSSPTLSVPGTKTSPPPRTTRPSPWQASWPKRMNGSSKVNWSNTRKNSSEPPARRTSW